jgi:hypothetical protein
MIKMHVAQDFFKVTSLSYSILILGAIFRCVLTDRHSGSPSARMPVHWCRSWLNRRRQIAVHDQNACCTRFLQSAVTVLFYFHFGSYLSVYCDLAPTLTESETANCNDLSVSILLALTIITGLPHWNDIK